MGEKLFKEPIKYTSEISTLMADDWTALPKIVAKKCIKMLLNCCQTTSTSEESS